MLNLKNIFKTIEKDLNVIKQYFDNVYSWFYKKEELFVDCWGFCDKQFCQMWHKM